MAQLHPLPSSVASFFKGAIYKPRATWEAARFRSFPGGISLEKTTAPWVLFLRLNLEHLVDITEWKEGMVREAMGRPVGDL